MQAIREVLIKNKTVDSKTRIAISKFIELSFEHAYVSYKEGCYKSRIGIPTGGSLSRQIADIFLHWMLFLKMTPKLDLIEAIEFWKRFIDDCFGIRRGSKRSFEIFVKQLNTETKKFGIEFPASDVQFVKSVHFLDLCIYLDEDNTLQYTGYMKPTDSKRYLNPSNFYPSSVFNAIPFSQFLRTIRNNSKKETAGSELEVRDNHFANSVYNENRLEELKRTNRAS